MLSELEIIRKKILVFELMTKIENMGVQWIRISPNQFKTTIVQNNQVWDLFLTKTPQNKTVIDFRKNMSFFYSISSDDEISIVDMFSDLEESTNYYKDKTILQHLGGLPVVVGDTFNIKTFGGVKINSNTIVVSYYSPNGGILLAGDAYVLKGYVTRGGARGGSRATVNGTSHFNVSSYGVILAGSAVVGYEESPMSMTPAGVVVAGLMQDDWTYNPAIISCGLLMGGTGKLDSSIDEYPTGGAICNSSADNTEIYNNSSSTTAKGVVIAGISLVTLYSANIAVGGAICNSSAVNTENYIYYVDVSGVLANGTSKLDSSIDEYPDGGAIANSSAIVTEYDIYQVASNGVICSGIATNTQEFNSITVSGGVICNGTAINTQEFNSITVSGGVICNGIARVTENDIFVVVPCGVLLNGTLNVNARYNITGSGGVICNGIATNTQEFNSIIVSGGVICSGDSVYNKTYDFIVSGGVICSGDSVYNKTYDFIVSGGVICNSSAVVMEVINPIISGGAICAGQSKQDNSIDEYPTGGSLCSGIATNIIIVNSIIVSGGTICSAEGLTYVIYNGSASGGAICSGDSVYNKTYDFIVSGGVICSGDSVYNKTYDFIVSGGVICNSSAVVMEVINPIISGGAICNSSAVVMEVINPIISGGAVCSGTAPNSVDGASSIQRIGIGTYFNVSGATGTINFGIGTVDVLTDDIIAVCVATEWQSTVGNITGDFEGNGLNSAISTYTVNGISLKILYLVIEEDLAGGTLSVSFSQTNQGAASTAFIIRGLPTRTLDLSKTNTGTSTSPTVNNTQTMNQSHEFCQAMLVLNDPDGVIGPWQDGFTETFKRDENNAPSSENFYYADAYRIITTITEPNPNLTDCTNAEWMMIMVTFA